MENFTETIKAIRQRAESAETTGDKKLKCRLNYAASIFEALEQKEIDPNDLKDYTDEIKNLIQADDLNRKDISRFYTKLLGFLAKKYGYVTEKYHQNLWMVLGMTLFGVPFGLMFGLTLDNFAFFGIGLPIGMPIGMAIGMEKDKKAKQEGKVLAVANQF